jgi:hypothetical protein
VYLTSIVNIMAYSHIAIAKAASMRSAHIV